jgi:hypothetical protein
VCGPDATFASVLLDVALSPRATRSTPVFAKDFDGRLHVRNT